MAVLFMTGARAAPPFALGLPSEACLFHLGLEPEPSALPGGLLC